MSDRRGARRLHPVGQAGAVRARHEPARRPRASLGVDLDSVCGGRGICGRCQVVVSEGEFAKHGIDVARRPPHGVQRRRSRRYRERSGLAPDRRLGCHARVCGDLVVDVPPESQVHRQVVRKEADAHPIEVDPVVRLHYVEVREPDMRRPAATSSGCWRRSSATGQLTGLACDAHVLRDAAAHAARGRLDRHGRGARRRRRSSPCGRGSTTARSAWRSTSARRPWPGTSATWRAARSSRSAGAMNPQIRFGEDLMSRVSYVMMNPGAETELTRVDPRVRRRADRASCARRPATSPPTSWRSRWSATRSCITCSWGSIPTELGGAPFALATDEAVHRRAAELDLHGREPGRARVPAAVHRRPRRRRHRRRDPVRGAARAGRS